MLIHITPRLYAPFRNIIVVDMDIEPFGLHLGAAELKAGRPYPNKRWAVACRRPWRKAMDGVLIETREFIEKFDCRMRRAVEASVVVTRQVEYTIVDRDFGAASDKTMLWSGCCAELGGWPERRPAWWKPGLAPVHAQPAMEIDPFATRKTAAEDVVDAETGWIVTRRERFTMPTIEPERLLSSKLDDPLPTAAMALRVG